MCELNRRGALHTLPTQTKMLAAEFTASACEQLLCGTAGHIGISFINSQAAEKG